ncbi:diphosphomevalonate decarboxylase [Zhouia amylolytica]|uniref:Diphosphomevalonate decarboxylase n=1 Tax=Zhouia amylolytica TaxID=376730 RepID=A0A1I6P3B6_9FLAO|nr:diphosphomevalonate decarboxylase [Zhouia amylolytica]SFS34693.1 diphosphomevalonate decarboxylase [Zhouia amylolytica]
MTENDFVSSRYIENQIEGTVTWKSPSNIALVKYWGKKENQIPANPSISFTLDHCATTTTVAYVKRNKEQQQERFSFDLLFEGSPKPEFKPKIVKFFERVEKYIPFVKDYHFSIDTSNSFPHSSGIASSASGMSALALCLMSVEKALNEKITNDYFNQKASFLARLGSGSACRSIEGEMVVWGQNEDVKEASDLYGVKLPQEIHPVFKNYQDTILLVDKGQKQVSSTVGHDLMHGHPFAEMRFKQAETNLSKLIKILQNGDQKGFIELVESEALTLHAMMMTSLPYFILMKPHTLQIINKIWEYRSATGSNLCFTLDAGANVHLLYPENEKDTVLTFIKNELVAYCENGQYICDQIGLGAELIKN